MHFLVAGNTRSSRLFDPFFCWTGYNGPLPTPKTKPDEAIATILKAMSTNDKVCVLP
jgi:hypothetical protein